MTAQNAPPLTFYPLGYAEAYISAVNDLSAEQLTALTAPFDDKKPVSLLSAAELTVTCNLDDVQLPEHYLLRLWLYTNRSTYKPTSKAKSKVGRAVPEALEAVQEFEREASPDNTVRVSFAAPLSIVRIHLEVRGIKRDSPLWTSDISG